MFAWWSLQHKRNYKKTAILWKKFQKIFFYFQHFSFFTYQKPQYFTWIICCCTVCELSTNSQIKPNNLELFRKKSKIKWMWWNEIMAKDSHKMCRMTLTRMSITNENKNVHGKHTENWLKFTIMLGLVWYHYRRHVAYPIAKITGTILVFPR